MIRNPFLLKGYISSEYFCNRDIETSKMISAIENRRDLTLISPRRLGKTGLIYHVLNQENIKNEYIPIYCDIYQTSNLADFAKVLSNAVFNQIEKTPEKILKKIKQFLSNLSPSVSFNPLTLQAEIDLKIRNNKEAENSIQQIFSLIKKSKKPVVLAIDEFQQITRYPEQNVEALLRTHIQQMTETRIIFSGSSKHVLSAIFSDYNRPFYHSTQLLTLPKISKDDYSKFISTKFGNAKRSIDNEAISHILDLTRIHTYYVQYLCNRLFESKNRNITKEDSDKTLLDILVENEEYYYTYRNLLTGQQFSLLKAIGKEDGIDKPSSKDFMQKYGLGTTSTINSAIKSLLSKDLIFKEDNKYLVYDVFFSLWLKLLN
jgi:AAA+ ATPase superfamily predicted ATPase